MHTFFAFKKEQIAWLRGHWTLALSRNFEKQKPELFEVMSTVSMELCSIN